MRPRPTEPIGLYDPAFEHDACGVGFVARLDGVPTHEAVERGLRALANLEHRGAAGATRRPVTARGSSCGCRTGSCAQWSATSCRRSGSTGSGSASSRAATHDAPSWSGCSKRRSRPRDSG